MDFSISVETPEELRQAFIKWLGQEADRANSEKLITASKRRHAELDEIAGRFHSAQKFWEEVKLT